MLEEDKNIEILDEEDHGFSIDREEAETIEKVSANETYGLGLKN